MVRSVRNRTPHKFRGSLSSRWSGRGAGGRVGTLPIKKTTFRRVAKVPSFGTGGGGAVKSLFTMSFNEAKSYFFKKSDWDRILRNPVLNALHKSAYILRVSARSEVRRRKNPSKKDMGPTHWDPPGGGIKEGRYGIWSGVDEYNYTAFIGAGKYPTKGPYKLLGQPTVPAILEFGGRIWFKNQAFPDPPRIREWQPPGRVRKIQPRPYMARAWMKKKQRILDMFEDMVGLSPVALGAARQINSQKGSKK